MRGPRIKEVGSAYYHMVSRVVDRRMVFDAMEKERFRKVMRAVEAFSGVEILTYALLDNHFHILLHVPERKALSDNEFQERLLYLCDPTVVENLMAEIEARRKEGQNEAADALKEPYLRRMYDLSEFAKALKQRISQSFNKRHSRKGTLWEERFKSILVEGKADRTCVLATVAAYIDLNPVRAGLVRDPKDYRYSGYGEAVAGNGVARLGLRKVFGQDGWRTVAAEYRQLLYQAGQERGLTPEGRPVRKGFDAVMVKEVLESGGALPLPDLLRCRVRYFTDGLALGTRAYVDEVFHRYRDRFGEKRETGARPTIAMGLFTARRLRLDVITVPVSG